MNNRISNDEEMNIVLLRLLEYLGHANPFVSGIAYTEVGYGHILFKYNCYTN